MKHVLGFAKNRFSGSGDPRSRWVFAGSGCRSGLIRAGLLLGIGLLAAMDGEAEVSGFGVRYTALWEQGNGSPLLTTANATSWSTRIHTVSDLPDRVISAEVYHSGALSPVLIGAKSYDPLEYGFGSFDGYDSAAYPSLSAMSVDFDIGSNYSLFVVEGTEGESGTLFSPGGSYFPDQVPMFTNPQNFSAINPNAAIFEWTPWAAAPAQVGSVSFTLREANGSLIFRSSPLIPSTAGSKVVDSSYLVPGSSYRAELTFSRLHYDGTGSWQPGDAHGQLEWRYVTSAEFTVVPEPRETAVLISLALGAVGWVHGCRSRRAAVRK